MTYSELVAKQKEERVAIVQAALDAHATLSAAAQFLGMTRQQLHALVRAMDIKKNAS